MKSKSEHIQSTEQVAKNLDTSKSNGNKRTTDSSKGGGAQRGGPATEHAQDAQPKHADEHIGRGR